MLLFFLTKEKLPIYMYLVLFKFWKIKIQGMEEKMFWHLNKLLLFSFYQDCFLKKKKKKVFPAEGKGEFNCKWQTYHNR